MTSQNTEAPNQRTQKLGLSPFSSTDSNVFNSPSSTFKSGLPTPFPTATPAERKAQLPVHIYTPESSLRSPRRLLQEMFRDLKASRELAWRLFVRDIRARYRQSILGYVWAFLPPVATTLTFVLLSRNGVINAGDTTIPYPAYVMVGTLLWSVFADAVGMPGRMTASGKSMLSKINFPREALLLAGVLEVLFPLMIRLLLLAAVFSYYAIVPTPTTILALAGIAAILCLGFMIGLILTPIGMLYVDIGQALSFVLSFFMLLTPVVYAPPSRGFLSLIGRLNPVSPLIVATRDWLTLGHSDQWLPSLCVFAATLALLFVAWILYRVTMPILVERMGG